MKRLGLFIGIALCLVVSVGALAVNAAAPNQSGPTPPARPQVPYGYGGKITALRPGVDLPQSGGPADTHSLFSPLLPFNVPIFGTDKNISSGNEVSISPNPTNPLNFLAAANITGRYTTTDGGQTWSVGSIGQGGDPVTAFDASGRAYYGSLGNTGGCPDNPYFYKSTDGGFTFTGPVLPITDPVPGEHFFDKEWMTVDNNPTSPHFGRIYYTASNFNTGPGCNLGAYINVRVQLVYSDNQGATWSTPVQINDASHDQVTFTNPVAARDGTLYVAYQYQNCTYNCTSSIPMVNLVSKSTDGGVSFSPSITITSQPISSTGAFVGGYQYLYAGSTSSGFRHNDQAILGISPTNPNEIYSMWTDSRWDTTFVYQSVTGYHGDIAFSRSTDGGVTWSAPIRVNDDAQGNGKDQFFPWMTVGSDGTLHASWSDRRDSGSGFQYREYYSQSTDGGLTWSANQAVADVGGTPGSFIGDYSSIAVNVNNTLVLPLWTDSRSGTRVYTDPGVLVGGTPTPTITPAQTNTVAAPTSTRTNTAVPPTSTNTVIAPTATRTNTAIASPTTAATAIASPTSSGPTATCVPAGGIQDVAISSFAFTPPNVTIPAGTTIRWTVNDGTHTTTSDTGVWDSGVLAVDDQFSFTFNTPGTYSYHCLIHPALMSGTITVLPASPCATATTHATNTVAPTITPGGPTETPIPTATACTITFSDVPADNPFYVYVRCLVCRGIISGYGDGTFRPGNDITRGQIAKMVSNAAGFEEDPGPQVYEDVDQTNPFYQWINRLSNRGFIGGYPCGTIDPEPCVPPGNLPYFRTFANTTRGQLSKIVANAAGIGGTPTGLYYTDVPEDNPFYLWIMRLTNIGVMSGYDCGGPGEPCDDQQRPYFRPFTNVTRGQASKIVANTFVPDCQTPSKR